MCISWAGPPAHRRDALSTSPRWITKRNRRDSGVPHSAPPAPASADPGRSAHLRLHQAKSPFLCPVACAPLAGPRAPFSFLRLGDAPHLTLLGARCVRAPFCSLTCFIHSLFSVFPPTLILWRSGLLWFSPSSLLPGLLHIFSPFPRLYRLSRLAFQHRPYLLSNAPSPPAPNPTARTPPSEPRAWS